MKTHWKIIILHFRNLSSPSFKACTWDTAIYFLFVVQHTVYGTTRWCSNHHPIQPFPYPFPGHAFIRKFEVISLDSGKNMWWKTSIFLPLLLYFPRKSSLSARVRVTTDQCIHSPCTFIMYFPFRLCTGSPALYNFYSHTLSLNIQITTLMADIVTQYLLQQNARYIVHLVPDVRFIF